jgi:hypothetical protein
LLQRGGGIFNPVDEHSSLLQCLKILRVRGTN